MTSTPDFPPDDDVLARTLRASRAMQDAPEALIRRAIALAPTAAASSPRLAALRRILAVLVSDTGTMPALAFGLRAAGGGVRQIVCAAAGHHLDLRIAPAADGAPGWSLAGQLLGPEAAGWVSLRAEGAADARQQALDETGEFRFGPLPAGRWTLSLALEGVEIDLPPIELPPPA